MTPPTTPYAESPEGKALIRTQKPYLLRAMLEWIVDKNGLPHIVIDTTWPGVLGLPMRLMKGQLVLNTSVQATDYFKVHSDSVEMAVRFDTVPHQITIPMAAILAVYSPTFEGIGMDFTSYKEERPTETPPEEDAPKARPSFLKVVK